MKNWSWLPVSREADEAAWRDRFAGLRAAGIDAVLPEVFNNHEAWWASRHLPVAEPVLERLIPWAHDAGLEVHAWMHTMSLNIPEVYQAHPEWYDVNGKGESAADKPAYVGYYRFLCPSRPEVHELLRQRLRELGAIDGLDGIHLDYIRFPDVILASTLQPKYGIVQDREYPEYDYCYCDLCRAAFRDQGGQDPLETADPAADPAWRQFRCDRISSLVNDILVPEIRAAGKSPTAAVFPNWQHVRQEWHTWDLDAVLPMLYHSFYDESLAWVGQECAAGIARMQEKGAVKPLYSGVFIPALQPDEIGEALRVSLAGGADGLALFNDRSMTPDHWAAFREALAG